MTRRMLIVDDEETIRWALAELFMQDGWAVQSAVDGTEAVRRVEQDAFEFMITDLKMPGAPGVEVVRRARHANPAMGVMVLTGYASLETAVEAVRLGAWDYVTKPCDVRYLRSRVDQFTRERGGEQMRLASRTPLSLREVEEFRTGGGTEVLSLRGLDDGVQVADAVAMLREVFLDLGLGEQRGAELTQTCLEALAMAPCPRETGLRAGLLRGNLVVDVSLPRNGWHGPRAFIDRLGSRFGLNVRSFDAGERCHVVMSEGL
jgi:ActR/RegA family two-component response regulator